jgi:transcriptional regulator with XRE-family HTH domain
MKIEVSKEWCMRMAQIEDDSEIGAGALALDPVVEAKAVVAEAGEKTIAFSRFVQLARRHRRLTVEKLAEDADVDVADLVGIEEGSHPDLRTVYQLANYFRVERANLLQVAGLTEKKDSRVADEAIRFAARSEPTAALSTEERSALEAFVAVLSERK